MRFWGLRQLTLLAGLTLGCTDLRALHDQPVPLATLTVHVKGDVEMWAGPPMPGNPRRMRVGVVWADSWNPDLLCTRFSRWQRELPVDQPFDVRLAPVAARGCRDVLGFVPAAVGPSAALNGQNQASIDLWTLPPSAVMVGPPLARIAYAALVVFDDRNGNDKLDLQYPGGFGLGGKGPNRGDEGDNGERPPEEWHSFEPDTIYGTSFLTLASDHVRLVFREGSYDGKSTFFPLQGCAPPPVGLSLATVVGPMGNQTCTYAVPSAQPLTITLQPPSFVSEMACMGEGARYLPTDEQMGPNLFAVKVCVSDNEMLVADGVPNCKGMTHLQLKGCLDDSLCADPAWPAPPKVPDWWNCGGVGK